MGRAYTHRVVVKKLEGYLDFGGPSGSEGSQPRIPVQEEKSSSLLAVKTSETVPE